MPPAVEVVVRAAEPADGPAFLALVCALAEFEQLPPPDPAAQARLLEHAFTDPRRYELWVATIDQTVIAYAATFTTYSTFLAKPSLFLEDLFVAPSARRRGVATAILARLEASARERGCGRFEWMVLDWNADAQALYRGIGAQVHAEWRLVRKAL